MKKGFVVWLVVLMIFSGCDKVKSGSADTGTSSEGETPGSFNLSDAISDVISDPFFGDCGRLLFPTNDRYMSGDTLEDLQLTWYNNIDPNETVEIVNTLWQRANDGETIFYDIYTDEEKAEDPEKEDTGLFFFKGEPNEKFAVCNAGGGFAYVGAMQDASRMRSSFQNKATTPLRLYIAPARRRRARIWQGR